VRSGGFEVGLGGEIVKLYGALSYGVWHDRSPCNEIGCRERATWVCAGNGAMTETVHRRWASAAPARIGVDGLSADPPDNKAPQFTWTRFSNALRTRWY
jgi:hypothetical protein